MQQKQRKQHKFNLSLKRREKRKSVRFVFILLFSHLSLFCSLTQLDSLPELGSPTMMNNGMQLS